MVLGIYGAGGLGREIFDIVNRINDNVARWSEVVFIDDKSTEEEFLGTLKMSIGRFKDKYQESEAVVGIGEPSLREKLFFTLKTEGIRIATVVDLTAILSPFAKIGEGSIICEYATIHSGVELGQNVFIQPFCNIGHDIKIGSHSVFSSYSSPGGSSVFGERVYVGMQAALKEKLVVGSDAIVGMGSVVYQNVPEKATVVGNPARVTRGNDENKVFYQKK